MKENAEYVNPFKEALKDTGTISLEEFIEVFPEYKHIYEEMKLRYHSDHSVTAWVKLAKKTDERLKRPKTQDDIDLEYYSKFLSISEEAALLFYRYMNEVKSQSRLKAVADKDMQDYIIETIRNALNDYAGVSYAVDRAAFIEICKLKKDEIEMQRLEIFKDVKSRVVKHFENLGFTLSERNLNSIEWWVNNYKIQY